MKKIENFEELIADYVGPDKIIIDTKLTNLTAPGENYMSEMVKIQVTLKNKDTEGANEDLHFVAKLVINNDFLGSTSVLTKSEILFYTKVVPAIERFLGKHGLPAPAFFPEFIGGRINLTGADLPDKNAVLLLENLKEKGYENLDRHIGFNLETAKLILSDLAVFHAAPLAMKLLEPEIFESEIKANCKGVPPHNPPEVPPKDFQNQQSDDSQKPPDLREPPPIFNLLLEFFKNDSQFSHIVDGYQRFKEEVEELFKDRPEDFYNQKIIEPFATLVHMDMWVNNTMQVFRDGRAIKNKLVDFQMCFIGSPAQDLVFFLFSSVQLSCLKERLDELVQYYHEKFANVLRKCGCYESRFSYEKFLEELRTCGRRGVGQCIFLLPTVIFAKKGEVFELKNADKMTIDNISLSAREKLFFLCSEAAKRRWF